MKKIKHMFNHLGVLLIFAACSPNNQNDILQETKLTMDFTDKIISKKIYFGHQSVGNNIISGCKELLGLQFKPLDINNYDNFNPENSFFAHNCIGKNYKPITKCDDFANVVINKLRGNVDIAAMKFCYVDINSKTDVGALLDYYSKTIERIHSEFPNIKIVHITIPLTSNHGFKNKLKILIKGDSNILRNKYNNMLKEKYTNEPVFDLAKIESIRPDGSETNYIKGKNIVYILAPDYTDDGGHLNSIGGKKVAERFLYFLSQL